MCAPHGRAQLRLTPRTGSRARVRRTSVSTKHTCPQAPLSRDIAQASARFTKGQNTRKGNVKAAYPSARFAKSAPLLKAMHNPGQDRL